MNALCIIAGDAHPRLARSIVELTGGALLPTAVGSFADGERRVQIEGDVAGSDVYVVQPTSPPVNDTLMVLALIGDAARAAGAARITAVVPYFGYARQDTRKSAGEPRSAQLAARILECAGFDRLVALELHSAALDSAFRIPLVHLQADEAALALIRSWKLPALTVVSPDAGGLKRAQRYASALDAALAVVAKTRPQPDAAASLALLGDVRGRHCLIVDDLASTGATIAGAARMLRKAGAAEVHAFFAHAVMGAAAVHMMKGAGVQRIGVTDSVAPLECREAEMLEVAQIAPLLARALARLAGAGAASGKR